MAARKEQVWWHGVNITDALKKIHAEHPVESLPRRRPQWQSVSKFFARAEADLAREVRGALGAHSPKSPSPRPVSANTKRTSSKRQPVLRRPQSAPALLRNEEAGLILKKTHQDGLRQHLEDVAVAERLGWLKREGRTKRDFINAVDVLKDPILFDLKVLHSSAARARSEPRPVGKAKAVEELRGLARSLQDDTYHHCNRLQIPHKVVEGKNLRCLFERLQEIQSLTALAKSRERSKSSSTTRASKPELGAHFSDCLKGLWGAATSVSPGDMSHPLVKLAYFLHGHHPGRMRMVLEAFDRCCKGTINQEDFCTGLELMAYECVLDYRELFTMIMLNTEGKRELELRWLEDYLKSLVDESHRL